ncbi:MAG: hypothetical protein LBT12_03575 [Oscillospiraceae bacterium]|jgi:hypothetical protein|nr:hypothetical protein [Oscillospiraceae bacterium]
MPYIQVNLSEKLSDEKITELKSAIGRIVEIIPGKAEWGLMVDVEDGKNLFFGGKPDNNAFVDTRVHGDCAAEVKAEFTRALYGVLERVAGVPKEKLYTNFTVCDTWGAFGEIH